MKRETDQPKDLEVRKITLKSPDMLEDRATPAGIGPAVTGRSAGVVATTTACAS